MLRQRSLIPGVRSGTGRTLLTVQGSVRKYRMLSPIVRCRKKLRATFLRSHADGCMLRGETPQTCESFKQCAESPWGQARTGSAGLIIHQDGLPALACIAHAVHYCSMGFEVSRYATHQAWPLSSASGVVVDSLASLGCTCVGSSADNMGDTCNVKKAENVVSKISTLMSRSMNRR